MTDTTSQIRHDQMTNSILALTREIGITRTEMQKEFGEVKADIREVKTQLKHVPDDKEIGTLVESKIVDLARSVMTDARDVVNTRLEKFKKMVIEQRTPTQPIKVSTTSKGWLDNIEWTKLFKISIAVGLALGAAVAGYLIGSSYIIGG